MKKDFTGTRRIILRHKYYNAYYEGGKKVKAVKPTRWTNFKELQQQQIDELKRRINDYLDKKEGRGRGGGMGPQIPPHNPKKQYIEEIIRNEHGNKIFLRYHSLKHRMAILEQLSNETDEMYQVTLDTTGSYIYKTVKKPHVVNKTEMTMLNEAELGIKERDKRLKRGEKGKLMGKLMQWM